MKQWISRSSHGNLTLDTDIRAFIISEFHYSRMLFGKKSFRI